MKDANLFSFFCYSNSNKYANFLVYLQFNIIILAAPDLFTIPDGKMVILQVTKKP